MAADKTKEIVHAEPTKDLFISILTKDLTLKDAIGDLVDNSLDGARRTCADDNYEGFWVKIEIAADSFSITDNCGGIPVDLARDYAFRFGRPQDTESVKQMESVKGIVKRSVGQFGIGMKRALFKIGKHFRVESVTDESHFIVDEDIDKWKKLDEWTFGFTPVSDRKTLDEPGTVIKITSLLDDVAEQFRIENFTIELAKELKLEHAYNIDKGLKITVNGEYLEPPPLLLIQSDTFSPAYHRREFPEGMEVEIFAGIARKNLDEGGWYIFCNDRLILGSEQSSVTGWGISRQTPKYHGQYDRFRGYVFFSADDGTLLPLNTAKTNMDMDSARFQAIRSSMIEMMRPVITFLNALHEESGAYERKEISEQPLRDALESAESEDLKPVLEICKSEPQFKYPKQLPRGQRPKVRSIQYSKPEVEIEEVKDSLGAQSLREVGERTFDYYVEMELRG